MTTDTTLGAEAIRAEAERLRQVAEMDAVRSTAEQLKVTFEQMEVVETLRRMSHLLRDGPKGPPS